MKKEIILKLPNGVFYEYTTFKKKAKVSVKDKASKQLYRTYRFNNVPLYQHRYLSWENLNCCGGWQYDKTYLENAVQEHKKLVADIVNITKEEINMDEWIKRLALDKSKTNIITKIEKNWNGDYHRYCLIITRNGCLADFYNLEEIIQMYKTHNIDIIYDKKRLNALWYQPLSVLYSQEGIHKLQFDFANVYTVIDAVVNGLALGYPIESTVGFLMS